MDAGPAPPVLSVGEVRGDLGLWSLLLARLHFESLAIEGLSLWGLDDGGPPRAAPAPSGPGFEALAARLSFSSDRISVAGTTIGYRSLPTPWEVRVDDVAVAFRVGETGSVDGEIRSGLGVVRLREQPQLPLALDAEFRVRESTLHLDRLGPSIRPPGGGPRRVAGSGRGPLGRVPGRRQRRCRRARPLPASASRRSRPGGIRGCASTGPRGSGRTGSRWTGSSRSRAAASTACRSATGRRSSTGTRAASKSRPPRGSSPGARPPCTCFRCSRPRRTRRRSR